MSEATKRARTPEELTRLFTELANAGDADGLAMLYEADAVLAFPTGQVTVGRDAIRTVYERMLSRGLHFQLEETLPTILYADLALTSTYRRDGADIRVQVARRKADGSWLRIIDRPETPPGADRS
jgi:ketosteroid isomerase-like protein